jgi:hypothetical protein
MLELRARLWAVRHGCSVPALPEAGAKTFDLPTGEPATLDDFCHAIGYRRITRQDRSAFAVRADVLERLAREVYKLATVKPATEVTGDNPDAAKREAPQAGADTNTPALCALADCGESDLEALLFVLGYRRHSTAEGQAHFRRKEPRRQTPARKKTAQKAQADGLEASAQQAGRKQRPRGKRTALDLAPAARQAEARRREEKRMADSPFAILRQLSLGGE